MLAALIYLKPRRSPFAKKLFTTRYISEDLQQVSILQYFHLGVGCGKVSDFLLNLYHLCIYSPVISLPTLILRST